MADKSDKIFNCLGLEVGLVPPVVLDDNALIEVKTEFDPATGSTKPVESALDFQKLIESYKDQCGVEYMIKQVKLGAVQLSALADDGQHSADVSGVPETAADAYQAGLAASAELDGFAKALGVNLSGLSQKDAEALITGKLAEIYAAKDAAKKEGGAE